MYTQSLHDLPHHDNIVRLKLLILDNDHRLYFVFEFLPTNLYEVVKEHRPDADTVREYM